MGRKLGWLLLVVVLATISACGVDAAPKGSGKPGSVTLSLTTVPTFRSITVSPGKASFSDCTAGGSEPGLNTASTAGKLGFPNGICSVGSSSDPRIYPITIKNTGIASLIYVSASSASPSDQGVQWSLCDTAAKPAAACSDAKGAKPGPDQYELFNFSQYRNVPAKGGITASPACDSAFSRGGSCWAVQNASQAEGIQLVGPSTTSDDSTSWTITVTWTPVPPQPQS